MPMNSSTCPRLLLYELLISSGITPQQSEDSLIQMLQTLADMDIQFKALKVAARHPPAIFLASAGKTAA